MKLYGLRIDGLKKIKLAELEFTDSGALTQLRGRNQAGKSSVIDAIRYLIKGGREIPAGAVNNQSEQAVLIGQIDQYTVRRVIQPDGKTTVQIKTEEAKITKPQEFLDKISGQFIDPGAFVHAPGPEKRALLLQYTGVDYTEIDAKIAKAELERRVCGRTVKDLGKPTPVPLVEPVDVEQVFAARAKAEKFNNKQASLRADREIRRVTLRNEISDLFENAHKGEHLSHFWTALTAAEAAIKQADHDLEKMPQPQAPRDLTEFDQKIRDAAQTNEQAQAYKTYLDHQQKYDKLQAKYQKLNKKVLDLRAQKEAMTANLDLIKGLEVTDNDLSLDGVDSDMWSESQAMELAILLAAKYSGDLRLCYFHHGECFDTTSLQRIRQLAEKTDLQVFMEFVDDTYSSTDDGVIYLEAGEVIKK